MDFQAKTNNLITRINSFTGTREEKIKLLKDVCDLYDQTIYVDEFSEQTISLLYYYANLVGVPHYFDLFCKIKNIEKFDSFNNMSLFGSLVQESSLYINKDTKVHIYQKELIEMFDKNKLNRYIISAPTSFGKTFIIYHLIEKMDYKNVVLIFPTISLLSENLKRIIELKDNGYLLQHKVLTLSEEKISSEGNILVFTPERFMTFMDKNPEVTYDFMFFDEIYKIDNDFLTEEEEDEVKVKTNRDIAFRISLELGLRKTKDALLAGPFLEYDFTETMTNFVRDNKFTSVNFNEVELVSKKKVSYKDLKKSSFDRLDFSQIKSKNNTEKIVNVLKKVKNDESIVYCASKRYAEDYALKVANNNIYSIVNNDRLDKLLLHLERNFTSEWCLVKTLKKGIGIHHGTIPKYIQREIIDLFNAGVLKCIFSTTTITEGVNTTAKNMIIISHKKGIKELKKFDVLNIMGRAGRFSKHFSGRVFILDEKLNLILDSDDETVSHKNYGLDTRKTDVDLEITKEKYLSSSDINNKQNIKEKYDENNIPDNIRTSYLTISPQVKIKIYRLINYVINRRPDYIPNLINSINYRRISLEQIQVLISVVEKSIEEDDRLYNYMHKGKNEYSIITYMLNQYLIGGFDTLFIYELEKGVKVDTAVRKVSNIVYNIFRYELVKYISVIDLIYKTITSINKNIHIDEVSGFGTLLSYLEYGAYTEKGRKASDLGLPSNVIKQIEGKNIQLDEYEQMIYQELKFLI